MEYSTTDIEAMVKQANILARLGRGVIGATKGAGKGALVGGTLGMLAAPFAGVGLAGSLGIGGAGLFSGLMTGGGIRGAMGGIRGLIKNPAAGKAIPAANSALAYSGKNISRAGQMLPALALGGGAGYMLSGEDNKLMGTALGATAGLVARPTIIKALQQRARG